MTIKFNNFKKNESNCFVHIFVIILLSLVFDTSFDELCAAIQQLSTAYIFWLYDF